MEGDIANSLIDWLQYFGAVGDVCQFMVRAASQLTNKEILFNIFIYFQAE